MLPAFAAANQIQGTAREGWLSGAYDRIVQEEQGLVELSVCCPVPASVGNCRQVLGHTVFYGFTEDLDHPEHYDAGLEKRFAQILADAKPDLVHIFGTEFPHTLAMTKAFGDPAHTLIGLQGLCGAIADAYMADLPYSVRKRATFRDRLRRDSILQQQAKFRQRAVSEEAAMRLAGHITGRTGFDRVETERIAPNAVYHPMNETLRRPFYEGEWDVSTCERHSIFLSQGDYPLKGFHYVLQAMPQILAVYPDAKLYVAGNSVIGPEGGLFTESGRYPLAFRICEYGKYLKSLIRDLHLEGHVFMTGSLSAEQMKERFLRSNVFVCASSLENSPNALCESMLLGMPSVASRVGGVPDFIRHEQTGLLFAPGNTRELAQRVIRIFSDDALAQSLGKEARQFAEITHNPDTNYRRLIEIYRSIYA